MALARATDVETKECKINMDAPTTAEAEDVERQTYLDHFLSGSGLSLKMFSLALSVREGSCLFQPLLASQRVLEALTLVCALIESDVLQGLTSSTRLKGCADSQLAHKQLRKEASPLTLVQVRSLEKLVDEDKPSPHACAIGHALFALHSCARWRRQMQSANAHIAKLSNANPPNNSIAKQRERGIVPKRIRSYWQTECNCEEGS
eukprot:4278406-Amphidinium_carterae.2